eukprot:scaffold278436_cov35-Tisochrysis_lutea.AAC.1
MERYRGSPPDSLLFLTARRARAHAVETWRGGRHAMGEDMKEGSMGVGECREERADPEILL